MGKYFGTDGVRGVANETLTLEMAYRIGRYLGYYALVNGNKKVVIGKDTRLSSSAFENALSSGVSASGSDIYQIGYCSTPCLAYVAEHDDFSLGVMISASHNPYYDNGIKVFSNDGIKFKDEILAKVENYIDEPVGLPIKTREEIGQIYLYSEGVDHYKDWLKQLYDKDLSQFKVLIDCANGSNSYIAYDVLKDLGCNVVAINDKPNGTNINNGCGSTHLESLKTYIVQDKYDIGFAFDGDADRLQAVDKNGNELNGDLIMYVLAKYLKANNILTNETVVVTGYSNIGLHKALNSIGIKTEIVENGDKYVLDSMLKNNYALGGEQSGHIIIKKDCNFGDGLKTALCLLSALMADNLSIEEEIKDVKIYPQVLVNQKVNDKQRVLSDLTIAKRIEEIEKELDGNGQILVRASGTEPLIRIMVEAETSELCDKYAYGIADLIIARGYGA